MNTETIATISLHDIEAVESTVDGTARRWLVAFDLTRETFDMRVTLFGRSTKSAASMAQALEEAALELRVLIAGGEKPGGN